jgi:MinD superfamily P-loop ATPase
MKIAVSGGKGGTGKSMVATSLAVELAKSKKVMLVDADVECPNDHLLISARLSTTKHVYQIIPKFQLRKCVKCGNCATACKKDAIVFVPGKYPAFVKDSCIGCGACLSSCQSGAITHSSKKIGTIFTGSAYDVFLVSGELSLGELASGEIVADVRKFSDNADTEYKSDIMIIDSAAGVGCPVIASLSGTDYIIAVTEPTPSTLHDMKRVAYLADHFKIPLGIVINKFDLEKNFCKKIEKYAKRKSFPVLGKIPYNRDFVDFSIKKKPMAASEKYSSLFSDIISRLNKNVR